MSSALKALPIEERIRLVEDLWDSIAADQRSVPLTDAQRTELDRRLDAYEADGDRGRPAAEAVRNIRGSFADIALESCALVSSPTLVLRS